MPNRDRSLIGRIVQREMRRSRNLGSWTALDRASGVSRSTLYRVRDGDDRIEEKTYARIEAALGLPYDTLHTAGERDIDGLIELGVDTDLVRWIQTEIARSGRNAAGKANAV